MHHYPCCHCTGQPNVLIHAGKREQVSAPQNAPTSTLSTPYRAPAGSSLVKKISVSCGFHAMSEDRAANTLVLHRAGYTACNDHTNILCQELLPWQQQAVRTTWAEFFCNVYRHEERTELTSGGCWSPALPAMGMSSARVQLRTAKILPNQAFCYLAQVIVSWGRSFSIWFLSQQHWSVLPGELRHSLRLLDKKV